jgi:glyoxylase-like metal-dependent hydrolase (beta-lactamase superfamily II)
VLVDPCFNSSGRHEAERRLGELDVDLGCIGYYFETHQHYDHRLHLAHRNPVFEELGVETRNDYSWSRLDAASLKSLPGIELIPCPGHDAQLQALRCETASGDTWVVGDAILDQQWLAKWWFYWPNEYEAPEIVETWRSVAKILAAADVVIPGHGPPVVLDAGLLEDLVRQFPEAHPSRRFLRRPRCRTTTRSF